MDKKIEKVLLSEVVAVDELMKEMPVVEPPKEELTKVVDAEVKDSNTERPSTGQSGPKLNLGEEDLNEKEKAVLSYLKENVMPATIADISAECFFGVASSEKQANSWVRNSLRRLVRADLVEKVSRGVYSSKN